MIENSPNAQKHLFCIWLATVCSRSMSSLLALTGFNALGEVVHPVSSFAAGGAFAAGFMLEEMYRAVHQAADVDGFIQDDHRCRTRAARQWRWWLHNPSEYRASLLSRG